MPDFTIENYYVCQTAEDFQTEVKGSKGAYKVTYGIVYGKDTMYGWECTCKAFQFGKGKPCKHITQVKASGERCGWMQQFDGDEPKDGKCPKCGKPVTVVRVAV